MTHWPPLKAVLFDAGNTLLEADPPVQIRYSDTAAKHGVTAPADEIKSRFGPLWQSAFAARQRLLFQTGEAGAVEYWREFVGQVFTPWREQFRDFDAFFSDLYEQFVSPDTWRVYDDVFDTLDAIVDMGFQLGLISNWDRRLHQILQATGLAPYFPVCLVSADEGIEKPAPEIFQRALAQLEVPPAAAVYVGDSITDDVDGARNAGLWPVHIKRDNTLLEEVNRSAEKGSLEHTTIASLSELLPLLTR